MIHDAHIHVGQFRDKHYTPKDVLNFLLSVGVDKFAVSSSSICNEDYEKTFAEMQEIVRIGKEHITPVLWISPAMLTNGWLEKFVNCGIEWKCLKIHGYFSNWDPNGENIEKVIELAQSLNVPLLFHTGGRKESDAGSYMDVIYRHPEQTFILAHSRPADEAIEVMKRCPNAWADTAFTPLENVAKMVQNGLVDRMMWGTDYPLPDYFYPNQNMTQYYNSLVDETKKLMSYDDWVKLSITNYQKLFFNAGLGATNDIKPNEPYPWEM